MPEAEAKSKSTNSVIREERNISLRRKIILETLSVILNEGVKFQMPNAFTGFGNKQLTLLNFTVSPCISIHYI
jgi:hypothetical protein